MEDEWNEGVERSEENIWGGRLGTMNGRSRRHRRQHQQRYSQGVHTTTEQESSAEVETRSSHYRIRIDGISTYRHDRLPRDYTVIASARSEIWERRDYCREQTDGQKTQCRVPRARRLI